VPNQALLQELGRRLRQARLDAGLKVSELARAADISRRHVTEAEAGRANLSIVLLASLATALDVPLGELCDLTPASRHGRVALVGLRGAGKSSVGPLLALALEVPFVELDQRVEAAAGLSLSEIFDLRGAATFRRLEAEALEQVLAEGEQLVLATGGSIVTSPATFARLRSTCHTVWLRAAPEEHFRRVVDQGDRRPMRSRPRALEELKALLDARASAYGRCERIVETSGRTPEDVARELAECFSD